MADILRAFGTAAGVGAATAIVLLTWRVYHDDRLTWFVVGGLMVMAMLVLLTVALAYWRAAMEERADVLTRMAERSLISARAVRTIDGVNVARPGADLLAGLIASAGGGGALAHDGAAVWGDDDAG